MCITHEAVIYCRKSEFGCSKQVFNLISSIAIAVRRSAYKGTRKTVWKRDFTEENFHSLTYITRALSLSLLILSRTFSATERINEIVQNLLQNRTKPQFYRRELRNYLLRPTKYSRIFKCY